MIVKAEDKPIVIEGEEIPKCPGCRCLVLWQDATDLCLHCDTPLGGGPVPPGATR